MRFLYALFWAVFGGAILLATAVCAWGIGLICSRFGALYVIGAVLVVAAVL